MSGTEQPLRVADGAGEGALDVSEQLGLGQLSPQPGAVEGLERTPASRRRVVVQVASHQLLAGAGFAGDEDGRRVLSGGARQQLVQILSQLARRLALAHDLGAVRIPGASPLGLELLDAPLPAEVEGQGLPQGGAVASRPLEVLGRERPTRVVLEIEDRDDRTRERVRDRDAQHAVGPTAQGGRGVEPTQGRVLHESRLAVFDGLPDQARTDARGGSQRAACVLVLGAETAGMEYRDLERLRLADLDQDALFSAQAPHGVDEALPQSRFVGAAADEDGERARQRVEQRRLVSTPLDGLEGERSTDRPVAVSKSGGEQPIPWRHCRVRYAEGAVASHIGMQERFLYRKGSLSHRLSIARQRVETGKV